jgi:gliding motility-associated-like protein
MWRPGPKSIFLLAVTLFMALLPVVVRAQSNQAVNNGDKTNAVNFTGAGCNYTWTNNNTNIGLPASGTGDIASFTATNTGTSVITATITATPSQAQYAYIGDNGVTISVYDLNTRRTVEKIEVAGNPQWISVSPDASKIYSADYSSNTVSVIDASNNTVIKTIPVGSGPYCIALNNDGSLAYVCNSTTGSISVIDTKTNTVIKTIPVKYGPRNAVLSKDGSKLYICGYVYASIINTSNGKDIKDFSLGRDADAIGISPDGNSVYVTSGDGTFYVINTTTNSIITTIPVGQAPDGITISPDGKKAYVTCKSGYICVINTVTNTSSATLFFNGMQPEGICFTPDGSQLCVVEGDSEDLMMLNAADNSVAANLQLSSSNYSNDVFGNFITPVVCNGTPATFTITVNPAATTTLSATTATGTIGACVGTPSSGTNIETFTVSATGLQANVTVTAPTGFEVSLNSNTGYAGSVSIPGTAGVLNAYPVYVRSAASAPAGAISGTVLLTTPGAPNVGVKVNGLISALPTVNSPASQTTYNGSVTAGINFSGTANNFTWTNDTPSIGLASSGTGNIASFTAINTGTTPVTATITVTPKNTHYLYVTDSRNGTVTVYDPATVAIVGHIPVGSGAEGISVSPDGKHVYVANYNDGTVSVINTSDNSIAATVPVGKNCLGTLTSPDNKYVYVANYGSNSVSVIDASSNTVAATISVGSGPEDLVFSPDGTKLYVTNYFSNNISVIDATTNKVTGTLTCGANPLGIAISPDGSFLYVCQLNSASVSAINVGNNTIVATIPVGQIPTAIIMSADGSRAFVSNMNAGTVSIINTSTNSVLTTVNAGQFSTGLSLSADGSILYVQDFQEGNLIQLNANTGQLINVISIGAGADSFGNFIAPGMSCPGNPVTFTITVDPTAMPNHNTDGVSGYITACQGTPSASPNIETFHVTGSNLIGNVSVVVASQYFEISLNANSGYSNSITIVPSGGSVNQVPVYVRSVANAPAGKIAGNVVLSSPNANNDNVPVTGFIYSVPSVTAQPLTQEVQSGTFITPITFSGSGNVFSWTNDTPSIGLAASGSGNIPSFPAINNGTGKVTATISVTPQQIAYAYITNQQAGTVSVVNTSTNAVATTITVGQRPTGVAISPDGTKVYITNQSDNSISVISTITNKVTATFQLQISSPTGIALSPDGTRIYVVNLGINSLSVLDAATGNLISSIAVGGYPVGVVVSPDGSNVYVTNSSNNITDYNIAKGNTTTIPVANGPYEAVISPDGTTLYVTNSGTNTISVVNLSTGTISTTIQVGNNPEGIAISPDGSTLFVTNVTSGTVSVINAGTNIVTATIPVGSQPTGVSFTSDGAEAYVTNKGDNTVSVISTTGNQVTATFPVGAGPESLGSFILPGSECPGTPVNVTITVDPKGATPAITASMIGSVIACQGSPSTSNAIINILGTNLTGDITVTAPSDFEISSTNGSGYSNSVTIPQTGGNVNEQIYIRSSAAAPVGTLYGNLILTSPGAANVNLPVTGTINIVPNAMPSALTQEVKAGTKTAEVDFNGPGDVFTWTNDTPSIGLTASGSGNVPSFIAVNNTSGPVTATVTVTPQQVSYAYIASPQDNAIAVINTATNTVVTTIHDPDNPYGVAITPDASEVIFMSSTEAVGAFNILDPKTNTEPTGLGWQEDVLFRGAAMSPDGKRLYMVASNKGVVYTQSPLLPNTMSYTTYTVGGNPFAVTVSPDGSTLYVTNTSENIVSVVNIASANVTTINLPGEAYQTCISPDGTMLYVSIPGNNTIEVFNTSTNALIATIPVGTKPEGINITPDGSWAYVTNNGSASVSVINTTTNKVVTTIAVGAAPVAVCPTSDGTSMYVINQGSNTVSAINTSTKSVSATIPVGSSPAVLGNFILPGSACPGQPSTFTIKVDSKIMPTITASGATGSIVACEGSPSADPYIQQITVSGTNLVSDMTATAPQGFEVSINPTIGYNSSATIAQSNGSINNAVVYVRAAASGKAGVISGDVVFSSNSANNVNVPVSGMIDALPSVNKVADQTVTNGNTTAEVYFNGTTTNFNWTNDNTSIGLPASGTGNILPFLAVNNTNSPVKANVTVVPEPSASGYAYIANSNSNNVSVIDLGTNKVTATINVGKTPDGIYVSPDGSHVYTANSNDGTVSVINTTTNNVDKTISVGSLPYGITVSPDGKYVYTTNESSQSVSVINTADYTVSSIPITNGVPTNAVVSPDGNHLYVTGYNASMVYVFNTATNALSATIGVNNQPFSLVMSPDGNSLYVLCSTVLYVVNTSTNALTATIPVGNNALGIAVSPDGSTVYVSNNASNTVSVINTATNAITATINVGQGPAGISFTTDGSLAYITNETDADVSVIDTKTNAVTTTVAVGTGPVSLGKFISGNNLKCEGTPITFNITVEPTGGNNSAQGIVIPNTFTPNGDGINDTWVIKSLENYPNCTVAIYNRYGEKLYSSIGYPIPWDGTYKGTNLPVGTYYYIINLKNGVNPISGWVAIVK